MEKVLTFRSNSYINNYFNCGLLQTVFVAVQAAEHNFELFFMGAEILRKLVKVQHSILVGVPGLHDLKTQTARAHNEKRISGKLGDIKVIQKIGCKHKYFIKYSLKLNMPLSYCSESGAWLLLSY